MNAIKEHDRVVLTADVADAKFAQGDVGTVVHIYHEGKAFEMEFISLGGEAVAVATLERTQIRPVERGEMTHSPDVA